ARSENECQHPSIATMRHSLIHWYERHRANVGWFGDRRTNNIPKHNAQKNGMRHAWKRRLPASRQRRLHVVSGALAMMQLPPSHTARPGSTSPRETGQQGAVVMAR